jgi:16S rRNA (uracil1498-N3)-methyltransferase
VARRAVTLEVLSASEPQRELPFRLEIAASIPKGDRGQFLIEKLTELGVTTFIPLACQRSLVLPREVRRDKLERYVIEASKQCGRNVLMEIGALSDWASYCAQDQTGMLAILAHPEPTESAQPRSLAHLVGTAKRAQAGLALRFAIGPEGGFSEGEIERARAAGWHLLDLGPRILRIETAALAVALLGTQWRAESEPDA